VRCQLDTSQYPSGIIASDAEMAAITIQRAEFHGEWNYTISPDPHRPNRAFISSRALRRAAPVTSSSLRSSAQRAWQPCQIIL